MPIPKAYIAIALLNFPSPFSRLQFITVRSSYYLLRYVFLCCYTFIYQHHHILLLHKCYASPPIAGIDYILLPTYHTILHYSVTRCFARSIDTIDTLLQVTVTNFKFPERGSLLKRFSLKSATNPKLQLPDSLILSY